MGVSDEHEDLSGYVAGELSAGGAQVVEAHLKTCADCRTEVESLQEMREFLGTLPPEALLDGPPERGDLLLQRTLRQVRSEARTAAGRGRFAAIGAAVVIAAVALGAGVLLGRRVRAGLRMRGRRPRRRARCRARKPSPVRAPGPG